jgi:hypothetical protein
MNIHYKIVEIWPDDHLIVARYWTDNVTEQFLSNSDNYFPDGSPARCRSDVSITLPVPTPTGEDLENIILRNAPTYWLTALEAVFNPDIDTNMKHIKEMVGKTFTRDLSADDNTSTQVLTDDEIRKLIEKFSTDNKND